MNKPNEKEVYFAEEARSNTSVYDNDVKVTVQSKSGSEKSTSTILKFLKANLSGESESNHLTISLLSSNQEIKKAFNQYLLNLTEKASAETNKVFLGKELDRFFGDQGFELFRKDKDAFPEDAFGLKLVDGSIKNITTFSYKKSEVDVFDFEVMIVKKAEWALEMGLKARRMDQRNEAAASVAGKFGNPK